MKQYKHKIKSINDLIPYVNNSRTHDETQITQIASSIKEFGFTNPILIDEDGGIIAGHGRVLAARKLSWDKLPCIVLDGLTEAQKKAYIIADNQLPLNAGWNLDSLKLELETLKELDFDLELLGFDNEFLDDLLFEETEGLTDEDEVPEAPDIPATVLGDIWQLGNHRLMCGDSTNIDAVETLMDGKKADMVFTDPPYNVDFKGQALNNTTKDGIKILNHQGENTKHQAIKNDSMQVDGFYEFISMVLVNLWALSPKSWYFTFCDLTLDQLLVPLREVGFSWKSIIVWKKNQATLSGKDYKSRYEPIIYGCVDKGFYGERYKQEDIWEFQRTLKNDLHPTMKPIPLIECALGNSSKYFDIVVDLFGGSGSTLIACEKTNRNCYMMELDEKYCDVIINRWQNFTGKDATHIESGKTYNSMVTDNG